MTILIANDDGIHSPGLRALAEVASAFGEVKIMAPDAERSSTGHAITSGRPLSMKKMDIGDFDAYRVDGTPADCVSLGCFYWENIDVVLSGINLGPNIGNAMWHSGTLAAAKQGVLLGKKGIALSTPSKDGKYHFEAIRPFVQRVMDLLLDAQAPQLVNVNFPADPKGLAWTKQSVRHYDGQVKPGEDPMGREHFWYTVVPIEETDKGTDRWAMEQGIVSLTPLRLDLTDMDTLKAVKDKGI
ncbi:5'/3'-nucleotidase SurE [Echinicola strongylocentroti]|uniref:5'-nucleotidase SurE n=1 Tax=Echinicola strongylocentroti TaxID=1795355 RepID=A0A2Z4IM49_9BACT|nr:5'/3'-nucleotidase SurE [Echinicola strongylocentroti]AWW32025.1 5'/3'-nucleotidase SurE [Echinicola strongylocentroti]